MDELAATESAGPPPAEDLIPAAAEFKCSYCDRTFPRERAKQTHETRAHKKFWTTTPPARKKPTRGEAESVLIREGLKDYLEKEKRTTAPARKKPKSKAELLAQRRDYYVRNRVKILAQQKARDARRRGGPLPTTDHREYHRRYQRAWYKKNKARVLTLKKKALERRQQQGGNIIGRPRAPQGLAGRTCPVCNKSFNTRPLMTHHLRHVHKRSILEFMGPNGVAPAVVETTTPTTPPRAPQPTKQQSTRSVVFCPVCGTNVHAVQTAIDFAEGQH
jgi:hypothetical protein